MPWVYGPPTPPHRTCPRPRPPHICIYPYARVGYDETELCEHATRTTGTAYSNQHTCTEYAARPRRGVTLETHSRRVVNLCSVLT
jgi:hypothetical protein